MRSRALREKAWGMIHREFLGSLTCRMPCHICTQPAWFYVCDLNLCASCEDERFYAAHLPYNEQFILGFKHELAQAYINDMRELIYLSIRNNWSQQDVDLDQSCMLCHKESAFVYIEKPGYKQTLCLKCVEKAEQLRNEHLARHRAISCCDCGNDDVNRFIRWLLVQLMDLGSY